MRFKKLVFKNHSGDYIADTYHNIVTILRKIVVVNEETLVTSLKDSDTFVLLCFGSVFEFKTFEEAEIKANEENQKHLEKTLQELEKYIEIGRV